MSGNITPASILAQGNQLLTEGNRTGALEIWKSVLKAVPELPEVHHALGRELGEMGDFKGALFHLREAIRMRPTYGEAMNTLGCVLQRCGKLDDAAAAFERSIAADPKVAAPHVNLGTANYHLGKLEESIKSLHRAIELQPANAAAHYSLALALLGAGHWARGWEEFEWRTLLHEDRNRRPVPLQPKWDGRAIPGKTIFVICEGGLGNTLQFIRYIPLLGKFVGKIVVECQPPLLPLLKSVREIHLLVVRGGDLPAHDFHILLMSLPNLLGTSFETVPCAVPYFQPNVNRQLRWQARLNVPGLRVGISWQGNPKFTSDRYRSISLAEFEPIAKVEGVRLFSLQKHIGLEQIEHFSSVFKVTTFAAPFDDEGGAFSDTAAIMSELDLVITSDTAIAHLAGALGVRTWVALSSGCDWRWLRDRDDSPWYPTMRLFRQTEQGNWGSVFRRMADLLKELLAPAEATEPPPLSVAMAPGELLDRLTILHVKMQRISDVGKLRVLRREYQALTDVRHRCIPQRADVDKLVLDLIRINEQLWQSENEIRSAEARGQFDDRFIEVARSIYRTNDQRSALKREINVLLGSCIRDEKQYPFYPG